MALGLGQGYVGKSLVMTTNRRGDDVGIGKVFFMESKQSSRSSKKVVGGA